MAKCPNAGNWIKCRAEISRGDGECKMPNHDEHCNIIPKRKPRMVRVKAWASIGERIDGTKFVRFAEVFVKAPSRKPCFILIDRKYLEAKK